MLRSKGKKTRYLRNLGNILSRIDLFHRQLTILHVQKESNLQLVKERVKYKLYIWNMWICNWIVKHKIIADTEAANPIVNEMKEGGNEENLEKFEGVRRHATFAGQTDTDLLSIGDCPAAASIEDLSLRQWGRSVAAPTPTPRLDVQRKPNLAHHRQHCDTTGFPSPFVNVTNIRIWNSLSSPIYVFDGLDYVLGWNQWTIRTTSQVYECQWRQRFVTQKNANGK